MLNPDEEALFEAVARPRPTFAWDQYDHETFHTQEQLDSAALRIGTVAFKQLWLFGVAQQTLDSLAGLLYGGVVINEPVEVSFDTIFATVLATHLLTGTPEVRAISLAELQRLPAILTARPWANDPIAYFEPVLGPILVTLPKATASLSTRWLHAVLEQLIGELALVEHIDNPAFFTASLLLSST